MNFNDAVRSVMAIPGRQLKLPNIVVETHLSEALSRIQAHTNRLEQVIFNRLTNARDAFSQKTDSDEGDGDQRAMRVRTISEDGWVVSTVSDTGREFPKICMIASSNPSSRPRKWAKAWDWDWPSHWES